MLLQSVGRCRAERTAMLSSRTLIHPAILLLLLTSRAIQSEETLRPGEVVTLSCPVPPAPWFFCVWESPRAERVCGLRHQLGGPGLCEGEGRLRISGNLTVCQLSIAGVEVGDHGDWTCAVSDSASLETVKQSQSLLVAVVGEVTLSPVLQSVHLAQGDLAQLVCRVTPAWPRPTIAWSIDTPASLHTDTQVRSVQVREYLGAVSLLLTVEGLGRGGAQLPPGVRLADRHSAGWA